jgi:hypothetical protein
MELKDAVIECLKESNKTLSHIDIFYALIIKNHIPKKDKNISKINEIKIICQSLVKEGVLIEKGMGKFVFNLGPNVKTIDVIKKPVINSESSAPKQTNALEMMWDFAEHKTNKKLIADDVFNFYAEEKKRGELLKTINDFIDYYKIEKNTENLAKWEKNFSNALIIQGISEKWETD